MSKRHDAIGIKQAIRLEWMEKTTNLMLAGLDEKVIRQELHLFLGSRKGDGAAGERSERTRSFAVNNLMKIWVSPEDDLVCFRNDALRLLHDYPSNSTAIHWAMISAAYPFWYNVARQTGRLLNLQEKITLQQITNRLKEQYGDRQTVSRYVRYVIRTFVEWNALQDTDIPGCYRRGVTEEIANSDIVCLLLESVLLSTPDSGVSIVSLYSCPALFPFELSIIAGNLLCQETSRLQLFRYGSEEEILSLRAN